MTGGFLPKCKEGAYYSDVKTRDEREGLSQALYLQFGCVLRYPLNERVPLDQGSKKTASTASAA